MLALLAGVLVATLVPAGPGRSAPLAPRPAQAAITGWTTYHYDNARDGNDTGEAAYGAQTGHWTSPALDGQLYASPLVWSGLVFVATENNTVYALNETDGSVHWQIHLATPASSVSLNCGNISPVVGITGTPVLDPATKTLYAVGLVGTPSLKHVLWAIDVASGLMKTATDVVFSDLDPRAAGQRGALALANGYVYIPFGGRAGDCPPYHTRMAAVPVNGGALLGYQPQASTVEGAGIWAPSGESIDAFGNVYIATGNGLDYSACPHAQWDYSNAVIKLSGALVQGDYFLPPNWCQLEVGDTDLGSVAPLLLPGGLAFTIGKSGEGWVLNTSALGQLSPTAGTTPDSCNAVFGGLAAAGGAVYVPCENELVAIDNLSTSATPFNLVWHQSITVGAPIVVGGSVWALEEYGSNLLRLDPATGNTTNSYAVGGHSRFQTPAADSGRIFTAGGTHVQEYNFANITPPPPPTPPPSASGVLHNLPPTRVADSRQGLGLGTFGPQSTEEMRVLGVGGVPGSNVSAVVLNVTAVNAWASGWIAAFPGGTGWPGNSNLNFVAGGSPAPSLVIAQVGSNGNVAFANGSAGNLDLVADVFGYFDATGSGAGPAGRYRAITPSRFLDTRQTGGTLGTGGALTLPIAGHGPVPAGASAVTLNLTATNASTGGWLAAFPAGTTWPGTSNVNFGPGQTVPNRVIVPLGTGGAISILNASGSTDVVVDVSGWFTDGSNPAATGGIYTALTPVRLVDTRNGGVPLGTNQTMAIGVAGHQGVPVNAGAASVNLTAVNETYPSFVAAYPNGSTYQGTSDLNTSPGRISSNAVLVGLGSGAFFVIHAYGSGDLVVDLVGWFS